MDKIVDKLFTTTLLFLSANIALALPSLPLANVKQLDTLLKGEAKASASAHVIRLSDGATLYEYSPDEMLSPASVTKLFTGVCALSRFTPVHTFKTKFYHSGKRQGTVIKGDLIVVGDGDPFLVSEKLWQLAADIHNMGISEITGDIVIDNSLFSGESRDASRQFGTKLSDNAYDAPITAFAVNFNTVAMSITPGDRLGSQARVAIDPFPLKNLKFQNSAVTSSKSSTASSLNVVRSSNGNISTLKVVGQIGSEALQQKVYVSISDPVTTAGEYVRSFFQGADVRIKGRVREGNLVSVPKATLLYELESYDLRRIVQGLNVFSNNFIADVLVKRLGAAFPLTGVPDTTGQGNFQNGLGAIMKFLREDVGLKSGINLDNGSGLAISNRATARDVTTLLRYAEQHMEIFPDFFSSLPALGWEGTLKKRAKGSMHKFQGRVRAKSGTLTEPVTVVALAGYLRHPEHGLVAFAIIENGKKGLEQPAVSMLRDQQDEFVVSLLQ